MEHESVKIMWENYLSLIGDNTTNNDTNDSIDNTYSAWHFCDNENDANELAELVVKRIKKATASLFDTYDYNNESIPKEGDLSIIINWDGIARCIIKTINVELVPYKDVTEEFAATEGEGDKSLNYWRNCHWDYFSREMKEIGKEPSENMIVVCEKFEVVYV